MELRVARCRGLRWAPRRHTAPGVSSWSARPVPGRSAVASEEAVRADYGTLRSPSALRARGARACLAGPGWPGDRPCTATERMPVAAVAVQM